MPQILPQSDMRPKMFQPKVKNRFRLLIDGIPTFLMKTTSLPEFSTTTQKIEYINTYFKIQGKAEWQAITATLYDPVTPSGAQAVIEWIRLGYETITGRAGYPDFYKKDIEIQLLGPVGDIVSAWKLYGAFIESTNFGDGDWADDGSPIEISCTIQYDYAVLQY